MLEYEISEGRGGLYKRYVNPMRLFRDHSILSQMCGNDFMVLKIAPPLR
jgi:hypothetical protein